MAELFIGAGAATAFLLLVRLARVRGLQIRLWQWGLTFAGLVYGVFVLEVVVSFLREGTPKGAAVMGTLLGFVGVVWGVLLGRFVFRRSPSMHEDEPAGAGGGGHV
jgi:hypothetical protein